MIIEKLREKFPDMPNLRVRDIKVDKLSRKVFCVVSYPEAPILDAQLKSALRATVAATIPTGYKHDIQIVNDKFNERSFLALLTDIIKKRYPLFANIKADKISVTIFGFDISVVFSVSESTKRNMEVSEFLQQLDSFFQAYTCYNVTFALEVDKNAVLQTYDLDEQERLVQLAINKELLKPQRYFNVTDVTKHLGKEIHTKPMYISDIRGAMDSCVVCGKISEKKISASKNNPTLHVCKFNLTDGSGATLPCLMFVRFEIDDFETLKQQHDKPDSEILTLSKKYRLQNDKKMKMLSFLYDGMEVLVRGKVVYSDFSERLELQMYDINKCRIEPINLQPKFEKKAAQSYLLVKPEPLEEYRQLNFDHLEEKPSLLTGKDYVVLSANVTGYNITKDKIFAICGVRVVNGHTRERLYTIVSPEAEISEQQLKETGITVRQLSVSPTLTEIISDLFKFVGNSVLVGQDLQKLLELLNYYAAPLGYCFKNGTVPQSDLLSTLFDHSTYNSKPNCSVIADVLKALKLDCKISPNAQDTATAVAKCMSALAESVK